MFGEGRRDQRWGRNIEVQNTIGSRNRTVALQPERIFECAEAACRRVLRARFSPQMPQFRAPLGQPFGALLLRNQESRASKNCQMQRNRVQTFAPSASGIRRASSG